MPKSTDTAIFLHRISYSETSLVTTFFTLSGGLQTFLFQGGKKKSQSLFPLSICEITSYQRTDSAMPKLTSADPIEALLGIQTNPIKSVIAFFLADVIRQVVRVGNEDRLLFEFLKVHVLDLNETEKTATFVISFLCELTEPLGIQPIQGDQHASYFSLTDGEFRSQMPIESQSFGGDGVLLLNQLFRGDSLSIDTKQSRRDALHIILQYYAFHLPGFNVDRSLEIVIDTLYT